MRVAAIALPSALLHKHRQKSAGNGDCWLFVHHHPRALHLIAALLGQCFPWRFRLAGRIVHVGGKINEEGASEECTGRLEPVKNNLEQAGGHRRERRGEAFEDVISITQDKCHVESAKGLKANHPPDLQPRGVRVT
jgi:hypothetical protein